jgi:hypothetical protein
VAAARRDDAERRNGPPKANDHSVMRHSPRGVQPRRRRCDRHGGLYRVGVDIGGTFTDLCLVGREGVLAVGKTLTTPEAPSEAVTHVVEETLD